MSELSETIKRLESRVQDESSHYQPEFIADLQKLIATAKAVQRATEMLQEAEDVTVTNNEDGSTEMMVCAFLVDHAVAILNGECD